MARRANGHCSIAADFATRAATAGLLGVGRVRVEPLARGDLARRHSKLDYLQRLGITALWLSSVFKQRGHEDTYHGYAVQTSRCRSALRKPCRFGRTRGRGARARMRVLLDIVFQHSGTIGSIRRTR